MIASSSASLTFYLTKIFRFENYTRIQSESYDPDTTMLWKEDPDLVRLRRHVFGEGDLDIQQLHAKGVELYIQGDWVSARDTLNVVDTEVGKNIKKISTSS